jgi:hypothetical protein
MVEMVEARKNADKTEERYDLFSGLLDAAQDESGNEVALSDDELIGWYSLSNRSAFIQVALPSLPGNMFIFLLAGHEVRSFPSFSRLVPVQFPQSTAHTLCFSFALLALYPGEQESLYQHIKGVMPSLDGMPVSFLESQVV